MRGLANIRSRLGAAIAGAAGLPVRIMRDLPRGPMSYEAGRVTRRDPDFTPRSIGVNALAEIGNRERVVARARDLYDNNPLIDGAVETIVNNVVGLGIWFEPDTGDDDLNNQIMTVVTAAARRVDPERQMALWESQRLFLTEVENAGECGCYYPVAPAFAGFEGGPTIELIDSERISQGLSGTLPNGNVVRQGIEYESRRAGSESRPTTMHGRTVAYHVLTEHPSDGEWGGGLGLGASLGGPGVMRIPVEDMDLAFRSRRVAQLRGVPKFVSAMTTIRTEDGYLDDAMLQARSALGFGIIFRVKGMLDAFRKKRDGKLTQESNLAIDGSGNPVQRIEAGSVTFVQGDQTEAPTVVNPNLPGPQLDATISALQRRASRAAGVPYSDYSGDASKTTFSSMRGEQLASRKSYRPRGKFVWEHHTDPWRRRVIMWGVLAGKIVVPATVAVKIASGENPDLLFRCNVQYPGFEYVNPAQEAMANATDIESGVRSVPQVIGELGGNWRQTVREQVAYEKMLQEERKRMGVEAPEAKAANQQSGKAANEDGDGKADPETGDSKDDLRSARAARVAKLNGLAHLEEATS